MTTHPEAFAICEKAMHFYADWAWEELAVKARKVFARTGMPEAAFEAFLVGVALSNDAEEYEMTWEESPKVALSTLVRIETDFPGYDVDGWELDGKTIEQGKLTFHECGVSYEGRYFADDGTSLQFDETLF